MRLLACAGLMLAIARPAAAEPDPDRFGWHPPPRSYGWDGGVIPLAYVPLALTISVELLAEPADPPRLFSAGEGGLSFTNHQYPTPLLYVDAVLAAGVIVVGGDRTRWDHAKGFAESAALTSCATTLAKLTFGRHRPSYDLTPGAMNSSDQRRSFWSGHSSSTLATATYLALYARYHVFDRWRPHGELAWWEVVSYAAIGAGAFAIPYSQYVFHRHHASDVIVGGVVGATLSTLVFFYQERRARSRLSLRDRSRPPSPLPP